MNSSQFHFLQSFRCTGKFTSDLNRTFDLKDSRESVILSFCRKASIYNWEFFNIYYEDIDFYNIRYLVNLIFQLFKIELIGRFPRIDQVDNTISLYFDFDEHYNNKNFKIN